jgi:hypothetical protein
MIAGFGVNHYRNFEGFMAMAKGAFPTVPALAMIAGLLAYIVPALMIVGGLLFAIKQQACISKVCIVAALSGIIGWAGVALMVGPAEIGASAMPAVQFAAIVFLLYFKVKKMGCCGKCAAPAMTK